MKKYYSDSFLSFWRFALKIGYPHTQDSLTRGRVMLLNGMVILTTISVVCFSLIYFLVGYKFYYGPLYFVPVAVIILYFNQKGLFKMAQAVYLVGSLLVIGYWCYEGRRNGNEFTLIAVATTATLVFERKRTIALANILCAVLYVGYKVYDANTPFVPDPVLNYNLVPVAILLTTAGVISFQITFFRDLSDYYKQKLAAQNSELQKIETKLKHSNEEITATNEKLSNLTNNLELLIKEKTNELQTYVEAINVNIFSTISDLSGIFLMVNEQVVAASGYTREELLGKHYTILSSNNYTDEFYTSRRNILMQGMSWRGEVEHKTKNGAQLWFDCVIIPMANAGGEIRNFLTLGLPITERKLHEKMATKTQKLLETVSFRASHNIRGPMARINGLSQLLQYDLLSENEIKELAPKFNLCIDELNVATSELVDFIHAHEELLNDNALSSIS